MVATMQATLQYWVVNWYGEVIYGPFETASEADEVVKLYLKILPSNPCRLHVMEQECQ